MRGRYIIIVMALALRAPLFCAAQTAAGTVVSGLSAEAALASGAFSVAAVDDATFARMRQGGSFPDGCTTRREDLRYLRVLHYNYAGEMQTGELVCHKSIAADLLDIFKELFRQKYQICRMALIDDYGAADEASMAANNTSCFCFRKVKGAAITSKHALGLAVDINPLDNPCVRYDAAGKIKSIEPDTPAARRNAPRTPKRKHAITRDDLAYRLFIAHGFTWGGAWRSKKDYQHFAK
ncbi:MAG: M15 family metallopeptidase [Prevotella sp.]|nr:M15 family metallopeptidase [Prevotella sp.]